MIHQYKSNGHNIVLDVNSGSVHVVDDLVYDILALYETETKEAIVTKMLEKYQQPIYAGLYEEPISEAHCSLRKFIETIYLTSKVEKQ